MPPPSGMPARLPARASGLFAGSSYRASLPLQGYCEPPYAGVPPPMCAAKSAAPSTDPALASATELVGLYRAKALSPVEAAKAALARIERHDGAVNAWCHLDPDGALDAARASEARWQAGTPVGLMDGVPVGIKDNVLV